MISSSGMVTFCVLRDNPCLCYLKTQKNSQELFGIVAVDPGMIEEAFCFCIHSIAVILFWGMQIIMLLWDI